MKKLIKVRRVDVSDSAAELPKELIACAVKQHSLGNWGAVGLPSQALNDFYVMSAEGTVTSVFPVDDAEIYVMTEVETGITRVSLFEEILAEIPEM